MWLLGHAVVFFVSGLTYWLVRAGRHNLGIVLTFAVPIAGVYFVGWWSLLTFFVGILFAAQMYSRAVQAGKNPFANPWRQESGTSQLRQQNFSDFRSPQQVVEQLRSNFETDAEFQFMLKTHLQLFEKEGNTEAAKLTDDAISYLASLPPRTGRAER